ncbi:hypothetical protein SAMN05192534_101357 [Alteribacillus persepolensis]|uniref:Uncharacterized protein n=1 Tax=Alteribacillus persepolensis TaxID=568899 RepID=A0A1G7Z1G8_9BACI|nr:hypothetical protein [Alteribacillus persepolensis]SDH02419.1 hypothetical protein SAMN05192534_101357 [Alteribacillus persepolensis]
MQSFPKYQRLSSLKQIEKAIGNAEKAFHMHDKPDHPPSGMSAIEEAKQQLQQAWDYHLKNQPY